MIRVTARFWGRTYTGALQAGGRASAEWPPSPYRLVAALLSGAHQHDGQTLAAARGALEQVVATTAPVIHAPEAHRFVMPSNYAPMTGFMDGVANQFSALRPTMLNGKDTVHQARMVLSGTDVAFDVDVDLDEEQLAALDRAASAVAYLGRSTHPAELSVDRIDPDTAGPPDTTRMIPVEDGDFEVRGWVESTIADLDRLHAAYVHYLPATPQWGRGTPMRYDVADAPAGAGGFEIVPLGSRLQGRAQVTELLGRIRSGLEDTGLGEVRVFPLTQVGHPRSTGACAGVGFYATDKPSLATAAAGFASNQLMDNVATGFTPMTALSRHRWSRPAARWVSSTPMPLHPDARVARLVAADLFAREAGVEPREVVASTMPIVHGSDTWADGASGGLRHWYLDIRTDQPVSGPIVLPAGTDAPACGVLIPLTEEHQ